MKNYKTLAAASFAVLLLAACGSSGIGDVFGGGSGNPSSYEIRGVVDSVDTGGRSLFLTNVSGMTSMLSSGGGNRTARVYFDERTEVAYQGNEYRPQDLERGDEVTIRVDESGNQLVAQAINVTYDASGGSSSSSNSSTIRGTVSYVDTSRRTIELDSTSWLSGFQTGAGGGNRVVVHYDTNASVDVQGRLHPVSNLERGDLVEIRVSGSSSSLLAQSIVLVRDVNVR